MPSARSRGPPMETRSASTLSIPDSRLSNPRRTRSPPGSGSPSTAPIIGPAAPACGWPALAATLPAREADRHGHHAERSGPHRAALASVAWADEIIVIDSGSTDGTVDDRAAAGDAGGGRRLARLRRAEEPRGRPRIERLDPVARRRRAGHAGARRGDPAGPRASHRKRGYRIPRVTWYLGRWIRSTDWYPDPQLRLYDRRAGRWSPRQVHESVECQQRARPAAPRAPALRLSRRLAPSRDDRSLHDARRGPVARRGPAHDGALRAIVHPPLAFLRTTCCVAVSRTAPRDCSSRALNSYYVFLKLVKLWERQQNAPRSVRSHAGSRSTGHEARTAHARALKPEGSLEREADF